MRTHKCNVIGNDGCFQEKMQSNPDAVQIVVVRSPRRHVASQFMMCKHLGEQDTPGSHLAKVLKIFNSSLAQNPRNSWKNESDVDNFVRWVGHFAGNWQPLQGDFGCYNPINYVSRVLTCDGHFCVKPYGNDAATQATWREADSGECFAEARRTHGALAWPPMWTCAGTCGRRVGSRADRLPDKSKALRALRGMAFVGVTELMQESLCYLAYRTLGRLPHSCELDNGGRHSIPHYKHGVPSLDMAAVPDDTLRLVDAMTTVDREIYLEAVRILVCDLRALEQELAVRLLSDERESAAFAAAGVGTSHSGAR